MLYSCLFFFLMWSLINLLRWTSVFVGCIPSFKQVIFTNIPSYNTHPVGILIVKNIIQSRNRLVSFQTSWLLILPCVKLRVSPPNQSPSQTVFIPWVHEIIQSMVRCSGKVLNSPSDVVVCVFSCRRSRQIDTSVRASPHVQDEGTFGLGGDGSWHLRDSQFCLFGHFSWDRLLVHHRGEPRHEHERSQLPLGTVERTRRCETHAYVLLLHH